MEIYRNQEMASKYLQTTRVRKGHWCDMYEMTSQLKSREFGLLFSFQQYFILKGFEFRSMCIIMEALQSNALRQTDHFTFHLLPVLILNRPQMKNSIGNKDKFTVNMSFAAKA